VDQAAAPTQVEVLRQLREAGRKIVADNVGPRPTVSTARLSAAMAGSNEPPLRFTFSLRASRSPRSRYEQMRAKSLAWSGCGVHRRTNDPAKLALHFSLAERYREPVWLSERHNPALRRPSSSACRTGRDRQYVLVSKHPEFDRMDDVLCQIAQLLEHIGKPDQAREFFHRLIKNYPKSKYVPDSYLVFWGVLLCQG